MTVGKFVRDDDCHRCDYDIHQCAGCGEPLPHGTEVCVDCANEPWGDDTVPGDENNPSIVDTRITHNPCCVYHDAALDCDTYRRTHIVESEPCCDTWAETDPYGGWVPHGCPAGFSSACSQWSDIMCKCLVLTLPHKNRPRAF